MSALPINSSMDIIAAQSSSNEPEAFQARLITSIGATLLGEAPPPCLLRAPTGSGKTFVMARVIEQVSFHSPTLWLWFVPFVNLIQQTEDTLAANTSTLTPVSLERGRNQEPASGMVILSTAQAVAKATSRHVAYTDGMDDLQRSLSALISLACARGLKIGMVVDEAHIGLATQTEFGKFAHWVRPDRLLMATATPKDNRLNEFIHAAGYSANVSFPVSRDDVVNARLNKRYIEAVVYDLRLSMQTVTDLAQTVLLQAARRNRRLARVLEQAGIAVKPLLLVQVGNGDTAIKEARECLTKVCGIAPGAIGEHSSDAPDPLLMASIANDTTKEVLIFKQSAGTGFDAPRAFVLASTKSVNDPDFAMQFIGRVMRVHRLIRKSFPKGSAVPPEIDTAYIYLANAQAQQGFEQAVAATSKLKSELQGETEVLIARQTSSGAVHYSNRTTFEPPLFFEANPAIPSSRIDVVSPGNALDLYRIGEISDLFAATAGAAQESGLDLPKTLPEHKPRRPPSQTPNTREDILAGLRDMEIEVFALKKSFPKLPVALKAEARPLMQNMATASTNAAARLEISAALKEMAIKVALNQVTEQEIHTELTRGAVSTKEVAVVMDRTALAREARTILESLPQIEEDDQAIIINVLTKRMLEPISHALAHLPEEDLPDEQTKKRQARDAAFWLIRKTGDDLGELLYAEIALQSKIVDATPLPDYMLFPTQLPLEASAKNIYGVLPPSRQNMDQLAQTIPIDCRSLLRSYEIPLNDTSRGEPPSILRMADFDGSHTMGDEERAFAKALDRAKFVAWWHRNPDRKSYSTRLARGEHKNYFYPDFIVCVEHFEDDDLLLRMIETKESTKDAARKSKHASSLYGRVLFITKDQNSLRWIEQDGTLGGAIDLDDLASMREWLRKTRPSTQAD